MQKLFNRWKNLTSGSINRKIFGAAAIVALFTALVKVLALTKELIVAWRFGTGDDLDAFLIAFLVPSFIVNVLAAPLNAALIPIYIQVQKLQGTKTSQTLFAGTIIWSAGLLGIITLLMVVTAPLYLPLIASGFDSEKLNLTFHLLCLSAPIVLLSGVANLFSGVLNAKERFALAAMSPVITPVVTIVFLLVFKSWGIFTLVSGLVCGALLEIVLLGVALHRQGISLHLRLYKFDNYQRQVASQYTPLIAGAFLMCSSIIVDQSMAAMLLPGSVAALNYGNRVVSSILSLLTTALSTAVIPYFSKMLASEDWTGIRHTFNQYTKLIFLVAVPLTGLLLIFAEPIIQTLFEKGSFTEQDTKLVAQIHSLYALRLPFYLGDILIVGLIKSMRLNKLLIWVSGLSFLFNIILNYIFIKWIGVKGIALSTSCVYLFSFLFVFFFAKRSMKKLIV